MSDRHCQANGCAADATHLIVTPHPTGGEPVRVFSCYSHADQFKHYQPTDSRFTSSEVREFSDEGDC